MRGPVWTALILALVLAWPATARASPSFIVIDADSGDTLLARDAWQLRHPASLTKVMTLYLTFEAMQAGRLTPGRVVPVSPRAAAMEPTRLNLRPGMRVTVEDCVLGMVTRSANDAAAAMGELLGGSESAFAARMTQRARALGMRDTVFRNASGLPDPAQVTTAADMALLARHILIRFPDRYRYFATTSFRFRGETVFSHNRLLASYPGADGLKTGYTRASGFNVVTSAQRGGVRLIGVVLGADTAAGRDELMAELLDAGFARMQMDRPAPVPPLIASARAATSPVAARAVPVLATPAPPAGDTRFRVRLGAFSSRSYALDLAQRAARPVNGTVRVEPVAARGQTLWRAEVGTLSLAGATRLCPPAQRQGGTCLILDGKARL
ncbi:D-alanyl-D-alanine carboxypeptidase [Rhodovastum atsumiense]|nr:D-alanyl-D-alanine carboxypeptidase family protein [Rhodovastum atsumiense]CAH2603671.1 D-alanyl-D-alanine carboxypeptidase [Rhodovastum atsumiense]